MDACGYDNVYYADTDGILLSMAGYERLKERRLVSAGSWGMLQLCSGQLPLTVRGPKDFTLGSRIVKAGYPLNQRQSTSHTGETAWYRLPWDRLHGPEWQGSWVEAMR